MTNSDPIRNSDSAIASKFMNNCFDLVFVMKCEEMMSARHYWRKEHSFKLERLDQYEPRLISGTLWEDQGANEKPKIFS